MMATQGKLMRISHFGAGDRFCEEFWLVTCLKERAYYSPDQRSLLIRLEGRLESYRVLREKTFAQGGGGLLLGQSAASLLVNEMTDVIEHPHIQKQRTQDCGLRLESIGNLVCKCKANDIIDFYLWGSFYITSLLCLWFSNGLKKQKIMKYISILITSIILFTF